MISRHGAAEAPLPEGLPGSIAGPGHRVEGALLHPLLGGVTLKVEDVVVTASEQIGDCHLVFRRHLDIEDRPRGLEQLVPCVPLFHNSELQHPRVIGDGGAQNVDRLVGR